MKELIKPKALKKGDVVATVSLSWGGAGVFKNRYQQGKKQFEEAFGVHVIEAPNSLLDPKILSNSPDKRLSDFMWAFQNKEVKAILTNIGGDDTIRLLPLMNREHFNVIRSNPKIFMGMSDTTVNHFMCLYAGIRSFYSPCLMFGYAENGGIPDYIIKNTEKTLFSNKPVGNLSESNEFIADFLDFSIQDICRTRIHTTPWRYIQGTKKVTGKLIGGCIDVMMYFINGTKIWPPLNKWNDAILFIETSEERPSVEQFTYWLRNFAAQGIFERINGILFARPGGEFKSDETELQHDYLSRYFEYDLAIKQVLKECGRIDMPVVTNMDFGHTIPQFIIPYGALCEIDCVSKKVSILDAAVE